MSILKYPIEQVFSNIAPVLNNPSQFAESPVSAEEYFQIVNDFQILVVGAGGLGCQIVKNLALSGIRNIHLIDMDTIDLTNLNRQFLFRKSDIGKFKADVVSQFIMRRCPGVKVIPYKKRIQELQFKFYEKFSIIIGGLDNIEARKYLNNIAFKLNLDSEATSCYYIDGATEGFEGQTLIVQPFVSSCYECSIFDGLGKSMKANYCTIANTPRTPQHCIQYVLQILWQQQFGKLKRDNDNLQQMDWVYKKSLQRAQKYKIQGVTQMLTMGVAKNIIPAIASTNALIASILTAQVFKILTGSGPILKNYFLYRGGVSIGSDTYEYQKKQNCASCKMRQNKLDDLTIELTAEATLSDFVNQIKKTHKYIQFAIFNHKDKILLNSADRERYEQRLNTKLSAFIEKGQFIKGQTQTVYITDNSLKSQLKVYLNVV